MEWTDGYEENKKNLVYVGNIKAFSTLLERLPYGGAITTLCFTKPDGTISSNYWISDITLLDCTAMQADLKKVFDAAKTAGALKSENLSSSEGGGQNHYGPTGGEDNGEAHFEFVIDFTHPGLKEAFDEVRKTLPGEFKIGDYVGWMKDQDYTSAQIKYYQQTSFFDAVSGKVKERS